MHWSARSTAVQELSGSNWSGDRLSGTAGGIAPISYMGGQITVGVQYIYQPATGDWQVFFYGGLAPVVGTPGPILSGGTGPVVTGPFDPQRQPGAPYAGPTVTDGYKGTFVGATGGATGGVARAE